MAKGEPIGQNEYEADRQLLTEVAHKLSAAGLNVCWSASRDSEPGILVNNECLVRRLLNGHVLCKFWYSIDDDLVKRIENVLGDVADFYDYYFTVGGPQPGEAVL
ncbi:MAG TPA: hypothetical protein VFG51_00740 [Candidatus Saccharimonadia bacterium]|nr:hypothetical protein [Candidatus Saccharimonadia bacterium]